jgi:PAS domain-containing protein
MERRNFLSTLPPSPTDRRLAVAVVAASALVFAVTAPFARTQLAPVWAFIPSYQSALALNDLITAILLYAQSRTLRSRALVLLASGYLFTGLMAIVHALTFPGLLSPTGLLGAGPQSTAWLYMFWHGGFPLLVIGYALTKRTGDDPDVTLQSGRGAIVLSVVAVVVAVCGLALVATAGHDLLPRIMAAKGYSSAQIVVTSLVWGMSLATLLVLWLARPHSVLDLWLMVVMCAWLADIALAAVLNGGRFDLGFYAGRIYGLLAASFVLVVLLLETGALYTQLARLFELERRRAAEEISSINAKLDTVVNSSPLPIFSLDAAGRVLTWNSAAAHVFGYAAADVAGRPFVTLPENAESGFADLHARVMAGEPMQNVQMK